MYTDLLNGSFRREASHSPRTEFPLRTQRIVAVPDGHSTALMAAMLKLVAMLESVYPNTGIEISSLWTELFVEMVTAILCPHNCHNPKLSVWGNLGVLLGMKDTAFRSRVCSLIL